jgi:hypothetical protein
MTLPMRKRRTKMSKYKVTRTIHCEDWFLADDDADAERKAEEMDTADFYLVVETNQVFVETGDDEEIR